MDSRRSDCDCACAFPTLRDLRDILHLSLLGARTMIDILGIAILAVFTVFILWLITDGVCMRIKRDQLRRKRKNPPIL